MAEVTSLEEARRSAQVDTDLMNGVSLLVGRLVEVDNVANLSTILHGIAGVMMTPNGLSEVAAMSSEQDVDRIVSILKGE